MHNYYTTIEKPRNNSTKSQERRTRTSQKAAQSMLVIDVDQQEEDEQEEDQQDEHEQEEHE